MCVDWVVRLESTFLFYSTARYGGTSVPEVVSLRQDFKFEHSLGYKVQGFIAGLSLKTNKRRTLGLLMCNCHPSRGEGLWEAQLGIHSELQAS